MKDMDKKKNKTRQPRYSAEEGLAKKFMSGAAAYTLVALCGKSGAGKDTLQKLIADKCGNKVHCITSCTTRPMREGEVQDLDYHFISDEKFLDKVMRGDMLEAACFRGWYYGTEISDLDPHKVNIGIFNVQGIKNLREDPRINLFVIELYADAKTRLIRTLNREPNPDCMEICRRFMTDEEDFKQPFGQRAIIDTRDPNYWKTPVNIINSFWSKLDNLN